MHVITGSQIPLFRLKMLISGCKLEASGMRLTRGPSCLSILKRELGIKGNRAKVITQAETLLEEREEH